MKKENRLSIVVLAVLSMLFMLPVSVLASDALVSLLTNQLDVTTKQAEGGAGTIFKAAKENMTKNDFAALAEKVPEATSLLSYAPEIQDTQSSLVKRASSLLGDAGSKINSANQILEGFKDLGLNQDMVQKFTPIITDYVKEKAGNMTMELFQSALSM